MRADRAAAGASIAALVWFLAVALAAQVLVTDRDWVRDFISDYAVGPRGWIYGSGYWALAAASLALAASVALPQPRTGRAVAGAVLLAAVGLAAVADFLFPTDILAPGQPPVSASGRIHFLAALAGWLAFIAAAILLSGGAEAAARPGQPALMRLAALAALLLMALLWVMVTRVPVGGLVEKLFILTRSLWMLRFALSLRLAPQAQAGLAAG